MEETLEQRIARLEAENAALRRENEGLSAANEGLSAANEALSAEKERISAEKEAVMAEKDALERDFAELQRKFADAVRELERKSMHGKRQAYERFVTTAEPSEKAPPSPINEAESISDAKPRKRRGRPKGSRNYGGWDLASMARETVTNDVAPKLIAEGYEPVRIGEDVSYLIRVRKDVEVVRVVTPKYRVESRPGEIFQALSPSKYPHSACTPSLAADIVNAKYNLDVPIYRYAGYLNSLGIPLSEMDLTNFVRRTDSLLSPLYEAIRSSLISGGSNVVHADETPIEVLDYLRREGEEKRKNGYVFAYVSSFYDNPVYLYDFSQTRETEGTARILDGFKGFLVVDGYGGYDQFASKGIRIQRCYAHIRRKFYDIWKVLSPEEKKTSKAGEMVRRIDRLFREERKMADAKLTPAQILQRRRSKEYMEVVDAIYSFLHEIVPEPGAPIEGAVKYFLGCEEESKTFLLDGHVPISNNKAERSVKPFAIMRRNVLFCKTESGAEIAARLFTIVQTAKANGLIPEKYIEWCIESSDRPAGELLPWSKEVPDTAKAIRKASR